MEEKSHKEQRIRKITQLYYSREDVQKEILDFAKNREVVPRYFEGFGKRPDSLQYLGDIFEMAKKGATSFHCSEELWQDPMQLSTGMTEQQLNDLRIGWDLLLDIDSKYIDYSKISAELIIELLKFHGVKNVGVKFSGSKGFHILVPFKAFPKEMNGIKISEKFPDYPRIITQYITKQIEEKLIDRVTDLERPSKYVKDFEVSKQVMPDIILVSPRHLFRMPYSLHEKTALASVVLDKDKISEFELKHADALKIKPKKFMPDSQEGEAKELLVQALDWHKEKSPEKEEKREFDFKPVKIEKVSNAILPPSIQKILEGLVDGRKRAVFILIGLFRSIGMDKDELEKKLEDWNKKNKPPLKWGYIKAQLSWSYRNKIIPPPNFDKDYYKGIGVVPTPEELRLKNPLNYVVKKSKMNEKK